MCVLRIPWIEDKINDEALIEMEIKGTYIYYQKERIEISITHECICDIKKYLDSMKQMF